MTTEPTKDLSETDEWVRMLENVVLAGIRTKLTNGQELTREQRGFLIEWIDRTWRRE